MTADAITRDQIDAFANTDLAAFATGLAQAGGNLGALRGLTDADLERIYTLAYQLAGRAQWHQAEPLFRCLCFYQHRAARGWRGLGLCRRERGDLPGAFEAFDMALTSDDPDLGDALKAAQCLTTAGATEQARDYLEHLLAVTEQASVAETQSSPAAASTATTVREQAQLLVQRLQQ